MLSAFLRYQFRIKLHYVVYMFKDEHTYSAHLLLLLFSIKLLFILYIYVCMYFFMLLYWRLMMMSVGGNNGDRPGQLDVSK